MCAMSWKGLNITNLPIQELLQDSGNTLPPGMGANVCHNMKGIHLTVTEELEKQACVSGGLQGLGRVVSFHSIKGKKIFTPNKIENMLWVFSFHPHSMEFGRGFFF